MAWPKRGTRSIVVDGEDFRWHYDACCALCSSDVFTAGKEGKAFVLFVDTYPFAGHVRPRDIALAVRWARQNGWSAEMGPTRGLALNEATGQFEWLPSGARHRVCVKPDLPLA